jgi:CBS-domain-containing membrane protein
VTISPIVAVSTVWVVTLVILAILVAAFIILGVWGSKQQKKSEDAQKQLQEAAQPMTLLVIDKKRMKIGEANLPKVVIDNVPKHFRRSKVPIVKAKVGPRIMTFMCDEKVFDMVPVKQEIKAMVGGIYILSVKSLRGPALVAPPKKTFWQKVKGRFSKAE